MGGKNKKMAKAPKIGTLSQTAFEYKESGNIAFKLKMYQKAIDLYNLAL